MPSQETIDALVERLDANGEFVEALELDAFTTLRDMGFDDLADAVVQERDRIGELVDRIYSDDAFRQAVEDDPTRQLTDFGIPEIAIGPVLVLAGAPDEVIERATADVEAHLGRKPATLAAMAAVFGTLAFAQQASAATQPAAQAQVAPAAQAQVTPQAQTQVTPATTAQVTPQVSAQVSPDAQAQVSAAFKKWQGVQANRLKGQGRLAQLLRAQGTL